MRCSKPWPRAQWASYSTNSVDLAQAKLITKPVAIEVLWFRFNVDVNNKIDALQTVGRRSAPTSAGDVPDMILELCGDDEVVFLPEISRLLVAALRLR